uniref:FAD-dependent oxidoreductase n=1 Tax=Methylobacterium sp. B34 TaxID=95563 RepID=UPI000345E016|nr:GMC family oxidoreductase [Methylobacterium sp. B34]
MPLFDLFSDPPECAEHITECDVCIIGSGPAGSTIARELSDTKARIVVLESGGFDRNASVDALNEIENIGRPREEQWAVRNRIVGGSSHTWGGRCAPFDEIDFENRTWVPDSGWPISLKELFPYFERSAHYLGLGYGNNFSGNGFWRLASRKPPKSVPDPSKLRQFFWQFSRDDNESYPYEYTRFGRRLIEQVGVNVSVIAGATVLQLLTNEASTKVKSVQYAGPDGRSRSIDAANVLVCAGGIENARILLASRNSRSEGLGNQNDLVGRYLMDHLRGPVGCFDLGSSNALQKRFGRYLVGRNNFRAGVRLSPDIQRKEELLNCAAWLGEKLASDDPWDAVRRLLSRQISKSDVFTIGANAGLLFRSAADHLVARNGIRRKLSELSLECMVEQRPNWNSRIMLSSRLDRFGVPLSCVDWRSHEDEARTMRRMATLIEEEFQNLGLPVPVLHHWVRDQGSIPESYKDVAHPTGTTRMSSNPKSGVVDINCQLHSIDGIFISGSSIFPTSGHCNPTQMIVALAIRLADHMRQKFP